MLNNLIVVITLQYLCISKHVVYLKLTQKSVSYISIKNIKQQKGNKSFAMHIEIKGYSF